MVKSSKRRGISTIVGGLIFLVLMASAFSTFYIAFDVQKDTINTQRDISKNLVEKTREQFVISAGTDPNDNNKLGIQVKNQGANPVEVANIWIVNKSQVNEPAQRHEVNYQDTFVPPGYGAPILENTPLYLNPAFGNEYTVKVVSTLGSIKSAPVTASGSTNLLAEMFTIPPDVRQGENVTVALRVTNVGNTLLVDVEPHYIPPDVIPLSEIDTSEFISPSPVTLDPTESTIFTWHYKVKNTAAVGTKISFTSAGNATDSATGFDYLSNNATDKIVVRDPQGGSGEEIVIKDELFGKPQIFMIIPNTFGGDEEKAIWGITIANPTDKIMYVSKVTVSTLFPGANDNFIIIPSPCDPPTEIEMIAPTSGWSCPNQNSLIWKNVSSPLAIGPVSSYSFLVKLQPGTVGSISGLETVVISTSTFTSLGAFGKGPYETSIRRPQGATDDAIVNVFVGANPDSIASADIRGSINGILSGQTVHFNVTMADLNSEADDGIEDNSELIINIPKEWEYLSLGDTSGYTVTVPPPFPDGSVQITAALNSDLTSGGLSVEFFAKAPTVSSTKMYVMHVLGTGSTTVTPTYSIGPLGETVLQVCPTSGCP